MADITNVKIAKKDHRIVDVGAFHLRNKFTASATAGAIGYAASGDYIKLFTIAAPILLADCVLAISATLGTGCTLRLVHNRAGTRTNLTVASTAAAANRLPMTSQSIELAVDDDIELLVGGANILTAGAIVDTVLNVSRL